MLYTCTTHGALVEYVIYMCSAWSFGRVCYIHVQHVEGIKFLSLYCMYYNQQVNMPITCHLLS